MWNERPEFGSGQLPLSDRLWVAANDHLRVSPSLLCLQSRTTADSVAAERRGALRTRSTTNG